MSTIRDFLVTQELAIQAHGTSEGATKGWERRARTSRRQEDDRGRTQSYYRIKGPGGEEKRAWGYPRRREDKPLQAGGGASGGSGGGPSPDRMIPAKGASLVGEGKKLDELDVHATAPPGCEDAVMGLKKKYGADSDSVYKIAWSMKNSGKCG